MEPETEIPPSLQDQTIELGKMLKGIADSDAYGVPSPSAAAAFRSWIQEAGPSSRQPGYFLDVLTNYEVLENTNRDLWEIFDILENYIEVEDEEDIPRKTFIGLPLISS